MTRVLFALILLFVVIGTIWFLPPLATLLLACAAALLACFEYASLAAALGMRVPRGLVAMAVLASCVAVAGTAVPAGHFDFHGDEVGMPAPLDIVLMSAMIVLGIAAIGSRRIETAVLPEAAAALLPVVYIGLPLGALVAVLLLRGRAALLLLLVTIAVSDSTQYYAGRAFGRHPLAPAISPKKTVEGAIGGLILGTLTMVAGGALVFPALRFALLALVGATIAALGIAGDLFESMLKRAAGVKDSSGLIPGHGGVLDRIDSWLFAAPVYYIFVRYMQ